MTHWHKLFEQLLQTTLFLPRTLHQTPTSPSSSSDVCPLCQQPHAPAAPNDEHQPALDDQKGWQQYWANKGQPWRTKPEISPCRQYALAQRRLIQSEPKKGIYPFGGVSLDRADVEWLLATHEQGRSPIDWNDERQRERKGLDLRGAQLEGADLRRLPLANLQGELGFNEFVGLSEEQYEQARLCLRHANLSWTQLTHARLSRAQLTGATLSRAQLTDAFLRQARLDGATLSGARLDGAHLSYAQLTGADLSHAQLAGADLQSAKLEGVQLTGAKLITAQGIGPCVTDVSWAGTNLSVISWSQMLMLGDEDRARHTHDADGRKKDRVTRLREFQEAMRATHQLAVILQDQGLTTDASRFAYRAKCLERIIRWYELRTLTWRNTHTKQRTVKKRTVKRVWQGLTRFSSLLVSWLFSWFLFLISGYGYRLRYCLFWYLLIVGGCADTYLLLEPHAFTWWTALAESVNVFHGRGASPNLSDLTHPARFAALSIAEAWAGLVLEVVLVATLLQRFFGK